MRIKPELGQIYTAECGGPMYLITVVGVNGDYCKCVDVKDSFHYQYDFRVIGSDGMIDSTGWTLVKTLKTKVIPDIPLDPSLHILQAGYLQDRQRKLYRKSK